MAQIPATFSGGQLRDAVNELTANDLGGRAFVVVDNFGTYDGTAATDTAMIQAAIDYAYARGILCVCFLPRLYKLASTISVPNGILLQGAGWSITQGVGFRAGTKISRQGNFVGFASYGTSILSDGPMNIIGVADMYIYGGGYDAILFDLISCGEVVWNRVYSTGAGCLLRLWEVFDSRFNDCRWEFGGMADGSMPAILLKSGGGLEFTNQIHFNSCVLEANIGPGIASDGTSQATACNEIYFNNTKIEHRDSSWPALDLNYVNVVHFGALQCALGGDGTTAISAIVNLNRVTYFTGVLELEYIGDTSGLATYIKVRNCFFGAIDAAIYGSKVPTSGKLIDSDDANYFTMDLAARANIGGSAPRRMLNSAGTANAMIWSSASACSLELRREDASTSWFMGRLDASGNFYINKNGSTDAVSVDVNGRLRTILGRRKGVHVVTAAGSVTTLLTDEVVVLNKTAGAATAVGLVAAPSTGLIQTIKDGKGDAAANNITITPAAGTIDGAASVVISANYGAVRLIYNGTQWNVV